MQNLGSCQKVIPRHNVIIETANKIINKQSKSVMLDFFTNCSDLCQFKWWQQVGAPCTFHSRYQVNFAGL